MLPLRKVALNDGRFGGGFAELFDFPFLERLTRLEQRFLAQD